MSLLKTGDINDTGVNVIGSMFDEGVHGCRGGVELGKTAFK